MAKANPQRPRPTCTFDAQAGSDGVIRPGVWDRVCVPGTDLKEGQATVFDIETMSQMVANFEERGDPIPIDYNHQSNLVAQNGQPAPALGFYGALALVMGGKLQRIGFARATQPAPGSLACDPSSANPLDIDLSRDGLWAFRTEVTQLGASLLKNYKLLSPTFLPDGTRRDGSACGYMLCAVAATNTPWQGGTQISFARAEGGAEKEKTMPKLSKLAAFAGLSDAADDDAITQGIMAQLAKMASAACMDEDFDATGGAQSLEDALMGFEGSSDDPVVSMRKMAAKFRRMAKFAGGNSAGPVDALQPKDISTAPPLPSETPLAGSPNSGDANKFDVDPSNKEQNAAIHLKTGNVHDEGGRHSRFDAMAAQMAVQQAALEATRAQLAALQAKENAREAEVKKAQERKFEQLADQAVAGGYPKHARAALLKVARADFEAARASVEHFLPKGPAHLFDRLSQAGGPIGGDTSVREESLELKNKVVQTGFGVFKETDTAFATEAKRIAMSSDPAVKAKVDGMLSAKQREQMFNRLLAAHTIIRREMPHLVPQGEE